MKKTISFLILVLIAGTSLFSFSFSLGLKAGAPYGSIATTGGEFVPTSGYIWGGNISAVAALSLFGIVGIQVEAGYSCRNGYEKSSYSGQKVTTSFPTFDVPLMLKLGLPLGFSINGGVQASFPVGDITTSFAGNRTRTSVKDANLSSAIWGLVLGADVAIPLGKHHRLLIDARFLMDFNSVGSGNSSFGRRMSFTPSIGYLYRL